MKNKINSGQSERSNMPGELVWIGRAISKLFQSEGSSVVLSDRHHVGKLTLLGPFALAARLDSEVLDIFSSSEFLEIPYKLACALTNTAQYLLCGAGDGGIHIRYELF